MSRQNVISSFRVTGIYPVDRSKLLPAAHVESSESPFIPLLTPTPRKRDIERQSAALQSSFTESEMESFLVTKKFVDERQKMWSQMYEAELVNEQNPVLSLIPIS